MISDSLQRLKGMAFNLEEVKPRDAEIMRSKLCDYISRIRDVTPDISIHNTMKCDMANEVSAINPGLVGLIPEQHGVRKLLGLWTQFDDLSLLSHLAVCRYIVGFADGAVGLDYDANLEPSVLSGEVPSSLVLCAGEVAHVFDVLLEAAEKAPKRPVKGRGHSRVVVRPGVHREVEFFAPNHSDTVKVAEGKDDKGWRLYKQTFVVSPEIDELLTTVGSNWLNLLGSARAFTDTWDTAVSKTK
jgi:hypothetical protein